MEIVSTKNNLTVSSHSRELLSSYEIESVLKSFPREDIVTAFERMEEFKNHLPQNRQPAQN